MITIFTISCQQNKEANPLSKSKFVSDSTININSESQVTKAIWAFVDKYSINYMVMSDENRETTDILEKFPLKKKIIFPEGITVEHRMHFDCHVYFELFIFYNADSLFIIPIYGVSFWKKYMKTDNSNYSTIFEKELNRTFKGLKNYMETDNLKYGNYNSIFRSDKAFVKFIMNNSHYYNRMNKIKNICDLELFIDKINKTDFNLLKIPYSKKQAIERILNIDKSDIYKNDIYGLVNSMILKFEYITDSASTNRYIKVEDINRELYQEFIW